MSKSFEEDKTKSKLQKTRNGSYQKKKKSQDTGEIDGQTF
jgi:hypothetical protein